MKNKILFTTGLFILFSSVLFCGQINDTLISGKVYKFTFNYGSEQTGIYEKQDSVYFFINSEGKKAKFQKNLISKIEPGILTKAENDSTVLPVKDSLQIVEIELTDGSEINGYIIKRDSTSITVATISGVKIEIPLDKIKRQEISEGYTEKSEFFFSDPNQSRLFISPTGKPLKQGKGYFSINEIFLPIFAVGITDYLNVAAGISLIPFSQTQLIYANAKIIPYNSENFSAGFGAFYLGITDGEFSSKVIYGVATGGTKQAAFTIGLGAGLNTKNELGSTLLLLGGDVRISKSAKLISENFIIFDNGAKSSENNPLMVFSFGVRFFGTRVAGDLGFFTLKELLESGGFPFIPWAGFAFNL